MQLQDNFAASTFDGAVSDKAALLISLEESTLSRIRLMSQACNYRNYEWRFNSALGCSFYQVTAAEHIPSPFSPVTSQHTLSLHIGSAPRTFHSPIALTSRIQSNTKLNPSRTLCREDRARRSFSQPWAHQPWFIKSQANILSRAHCPVDRITNAETRLNGHDLTASRTGSRRVSLNKFPNLYPSLISHGDFDVPNPLPFTSHPPLTLNSLPFTSQHPASLGHAGYLNHEGGRRPG